MTTFTLTIYEKMKDRKLTTSQRSFSVNWLNRSPTFMAVMKGDIGIAALFTLWCKLSANAEIDLASEVWVELKSQIENGDIQ